MVSWDTYVFRQLIAAISLTILRVSLPPVLSGPVIWVADAAAFIIHADIAAILGVIVFTACLIVVGINQWDYLRHVLETIID